MPVTAIDQDRDQLTMTVTAEFGAPAERVWHVWDDPRQLERWWGPPTYPATVVDHDLRPGGTVTYYMTGPDGDRPHGWWRVLAVEPPYLLEVEDGFADESGTPIDDMPVTHMRVSIGERDGGGSLMTLRSQFSSLEQLEQLLEMGMEDGLREAMGQIDGLVA